MFPRGSNNCLHREDQELRRGDSLGRVEWSGRNEERAHTEWVVPHSMHTSLTYLTRVPTEPKRAYAHPLVAGGIVLAWSRACRWS